MDFPSLPGGRNMNGGIYIESCSYLSFDKNRFSILPDQGQELFQKDDFLIAEYLP